MEALRTLTDVKLILLDEADKPLRNLIEKIKIMEIKFEEKKQVISAKIVFEILTKVLAAEDPLDQEKEHLWVLGLNGRNYIQYIELVHLGSVNFCICHPREVFRRACIKAVVSILIAHNHPSGNLTPSIEDKNMTSNIKEAGRILEIPLLDHVIVGKDGYYSFNEQGKV